VSERHNNRRWDLTDERVAHLNACAAQGMPLHSAANELNVRASTIKTAARRSGKEGWLKKRFPSSFRPQCANKRDREKKDGELRQVSLKQLGGVPPIPKDVATQWLMGRI